MATRYGNVSDSVATQEITSMINELEREDNVLNENMLASGTCGKTHIQVVRNSLVQNRASALNLRITRSVCEKLDTMDTKLDGFNGSLEAIQKALENGSGKQHSSSDNKPPDDKPKSTYRSAVPTETFGYGKWKATGVVSVVLAALLGAGAIVYVVLRYSNADKSDDRGGYRAHGSNAMVRSTN